MVCCDKRDYAKKWERKLKRIITEEYKEFFNREINAAYSHNNRGLAIKVQWKRVDEILKYNKYSPVYWSLLLYCGNIAQVSLLSKSLRRELSL